MLRCREAAAAPLQPEPRKAWDFRARSPAGFMQKACKPVQDALAP